jgi:hypothetical protein
VINSSYEKLQVYHHWAARFLLLLSTIHVVPFIYQNLQEGGSAALKEYYFSDDMNITGTAAFALLFFLVFSSFRGLRNYCYELWVVTHVLAALFFLAVSLLRTVVKGDNNKLTHTLPLLLPYQSSSSSIPGVN